jgi:HEAT repeat protein
LPDFLARIQSPDGAVSGPAWQGAEPYGPQAIPPLADLMASADFEVARTAKRAIYRITRHAGRPGAAGEARAAETALIALLKHANLTVRRTALWMLSEIGGDRAVRPMAALLRYEDAREDARAALMRLPGRRPTAALRMAFADAPEEFKYAVADALRKRGLEVEGYPTRKLAPSKPTGVSPSSSADETC